MTRGCTQRSIGTVEEKLFDDPFIFIERVRVLTNAHDSNMKRCLPQEVLCIQICPEFDKKLYILEFTFKNREMEWSGLDFVSYIHIEVMLLDKHED